MARKAKGTPNWFIGGKCDEQGHKSVIRLDFLDKGRKYEPMSYTVGAQPMIKGWEEGIMGQTVGSDITLVMPSELAYGGRGAGKDIMPYSPLVFNITIESVE